VTGFREKRCHLLENAELEVPLSGRFARSLSSTGMRSGPIRPSQLELGTAPNLMALRSTEQNCSWLSPCSSGL
jgi:hypothetical protein